MDKHKGASILYPKKADKLFFFPLFFPEKYETLCFGTFLQTISRAIGIELSGMVDLLLFRAGLRVSDRRKVSARQIFNFAM